MKLLLVWLMLACGGSGSGVPGPADLPGAYKGLRIPMEHVTVEPGDGSIDLKVGGEGTVDDWLTQVHAGLKVDGWEMNQAMAIPGGKIVEYLNAGKTLKVVAGGQPGRISVHMKLD